MTSPISFYWKNKWKLFKRFPNKKKYKTTIKWNKENRAANRHQNLQELQRDRYKIRKIEKKEWMFQLINKWTCNERKDINIYLNSYKKLKHKFNNLPWLRL